MLPILKRIVAATKNIAILKNIAIVTRNGKTRIFATDLEEAVTYTLAGVSPDQDSAVTLPLSAIDAALKFKSKEPLKIETDAGKATLSIGGAESGAETTSIASYPELPVPKEKAGTLPVRGLLDAIRTTLDSISHDENRFTLNGALLELKPGKAALVATDGHRLSIQTFAAPGIKTEVVPAITHQNGGVTPGGLLIPRHVLETLAEVFALPKPKKGQPPAQADDLLLHVEKNDDGKIVHVEFSNRDGSIKVLTRQLTGNFPDYGRVLPDESTFTHKATVGRAQLLELLKHAIAVANIQVRGKTSHERAVALSFRNGQLAMFRGRTRRDQSRRRCRWPYGRFLSSQPRACRAAHPRGAA